MKYAGWNKTGLRYESDVHPGTDTPDRRCPYLSNISESHTVSWHEIRDITYVWVGPRKCYRSSCSVIRRSAARNWFEDRPSYKRPLVRFRLNKSMSNWIAFKPVICTSPESDHSVQTQAKAIDGQQRFWAPLKQVGEGPEGRHDMRPNVEPHWFHTEAIPHLSTFIYSNSRFFPNLRREVCDILCERQRQIIKEAFLFVKFFLRYV